jgi:hypothetical protein
LLNRGEFLHQPAIWQIALHRIISADLLRCGVQPRIGGFIDLVSRLNSTVAHATQGLPSTARGLKPTPKVSRRAAAKKLTTYPLITFYFPLSTSYLLLLTSTSRLLTFYFLLPTPHFLLSTFYFPLSTFYFLLSTPLTTNSLPFPIFTELISQSSFFPHNSRL